MGSLVPCQVRRERGVAVEGATMCGSHRIGSLLAQNSFGCVFDRLACRSAWACRTTIPCRHGARGTGRGRSLSCLLGGCWVGPRRANEGFETDRPRGSRGQRYRLHGQSLSTLVLQKLRQTAVVLCRNWTDWGWKGPLARAGHSRLWVSELFGRRRRIMRLEK